MVFYGHTYFLKLLSEYRMFQLFSDTKYLWLDFWTQVFYLTSSELTAKGCLIDSAIFIKTSSFL